MSAGLAAIISAIGGACAVAGFALAWRRKQTRPQELPEPVPIPAGLRRCPGLRESLDEIEQMLDAIRESCLPEVNAATDPVTPMMTWKLQLYMLTAFHRIYDLAQSMLDSWNHGKHACAFILLKALSESASVLYAAAKRLAPLIQQRNFDGVDTELSHLLFGTRLDDFFPFKARNVLTSVDRVRRQLQHHRRNYDHLCEYAHPNVDGMMGLYARMIGRDICNISRVNGDTERNATNFVNLMRSNLRVAILGYHEMGNLFDGITALAIENLREQGRDPRPYLAEGEEG